MGLISRINAAHSANMDKLEAKAAEMRARNTEREGARAVERVQLAERVTAARGGLVAEYSGVQLYPDRVQRGAESHPLAGVRARVEEHRTGQEWGGWEQKNVWLTISGPGFEWPIRTSAIWSSRKAREFAARLNAASSSVQRHTAPVQSVPEQLGKLAELHQAGALSDDEYASAKARVLSS